VRTVIRDFKDGKVVRTFCHLCPPSEPIRNGRRDFYCEHLDDEATETAARAVAAESQKPE
jgi:hypothetical protein